MTPPGGCPAVGVLEEREMDYGLYVIRDGIAATGRSNAHIAKRCMKNGADVLQLRDTTLGPEEIMASAKEVHGITAGKDTTLIVCGDLDAALQSGSEGIHIHESSISVADAKATMKLINDDRRVS